jgi:hypothetical protein
MNEPMEHASKRHMFFLLGEGVVSVFSFFIFFWGKGGIYCFGISYVMVDLMFFFWLGWISLLFHMLYQKVSCFHLYMWVKASQIYNIMQF